MPTSPNVQNYHIGKGIASFKEVGGSTFVDLGNAPSFLPLATEKKSFLDCEGVKPRISRPSLSRRNNQSFLDEITGENLAMFALAEQAPIPMATSP
jgi:hypothetical protein